MRGVRFASQLSPVGEAVARAACAFGRLISPRNRPTPCSRWTTKSPSCSSLKSICARCRDSRALQAPARRAAAKRPNNSGSRQHDEIGGGKTKAAGERSFDQFDVVERVVRVADDLAEPLDLAFGLEIDDDLRLVPRAIRSSAR